MREVHAGSAYLSGQSLVQHFGLGAATAAAVVVDWPSGARTELRDLRADRRYEVVEDAGDTTRTPRAANCSASATTFRD
jgi:hypothetical protein